MTSPGSTGLHLPNPRSGRHPRPKIRQQSPAVAAAAHLAAAVDSCIQSLPQIRQLLTEPAGHGQHTGTIGRHAPESSEPWQGHAAAVYWAIHFGARRLEDAMRADIALSPVHPERGGTEANTVSALIQISRYAAAVTAGMLAVAASRVDGWVRSVDQLADVDRYDDWRPLPVVPGVLVTCPFCRLLSLRMNLRREVVRCFNPVCRDSRGDPPVARMEHGGMSGVAQLVFRDGREVDYHELAENEEYSA